MIISERHIQALCKAKEYIVSIHKRNNVYSDYMELKRIKLDGDSSDFRKLFMKYYDMNKLRNQERFIDRFFEILFNKEEIKIEDQIGKIVYDLQDLTTPRSLQFSFVSKLANLKNEQMPIYDTYVCYFFERGLYKGTSKKRRIEAEIRSYVSFLKDIRHAYREGLKDRRVKNILDEMRERDVDLKKCDSVRLLDFLVFIVGKKSLLETTI